MTIFKKSLLTLGLAALGFCLFFVISIMVFMNSLYYEINTKGLENTAKVLMNTIGEDRIKQIFKNTANVPAEIDLPVNADQVYRLTLIKSDGDVLWDSQVSNELVNHLDREEITAALEGKEASARRNSISTNMKRIYYALPVFDNNVSIGVFRLSLSVPGFWARISPVVFPFVVFICLIIIVVFSAIFAYSRSLSASLGQLVNIAQTSAPLMSAHKTMEPIAQEFRSLERAMRAMTAELNFRFEQAKSEGSRLEAILDGMSEAVFAMDNTLKLHLVNPTARQIFALGDKEINSMNLLEATRSTELVDIAKKAISGGVPFEAELTFYKGTEQHFHVYASPLANADNSRSGAVLVMQDVTRIVKLERVRKDFVANVSHELRTPIQLIKGFSETLLDSISDKKNGHFIEIIHKNAGTMENLTNDLLILADLEDNTVNNRDLEELKIAPLIKEAVSSMENQSKKKQIEIITDCDEALSAKLYGSFIIQALINLIENGIKYSPSKSKIRVSAFIKDDELIFEVRDKGIGIPAEHLERIFERFYRVDKARSKSAGGTGLGLSIVRHISLLHKGKAEAESQAGEGSTFRIRIPIVYQSPKSSSGEP